MKKAGICAVVPIYNAERTLETLVEKLTHVLARFDEYHIVLVDDHSADESARIAQRLHEKFEHITVVKLKKNAGQQAAVLCGLRHSQSDYTVIIDDDLENDPEDIIKLYERAQQGFDVVYGVDNVAFKKGVFRGVGSKVRDGLINYLTDKPKDKRVCSFRIMRADIVAKVTAADTKFVYISLEILKHSVNIDNVGVEYAHSHRSGYHALSLTHLLVKMVMYYGKLFGRLRRHGSCYEIEEVLKG